MHKNIAAFLIAAAVGTSAFAQPATPATPATPASPALEHRADPVKHETGKSTEKTTEKAQKKASKEAAKTEKKTEKEVEKAVDAKQSDMKHDDHGMHKGEGGKK